MLRSPVSSIIRPFVGSGVAGEPRDLLDVATDYLGGIEPLHYWDFITNRALFSSVSYGGVANTPGWSFTRATVGTAETVAGTIVQFPAGELRRTDKGLLIEGARTNLFLNSDVGVTQGVTVAAVAHTLSFRGTGTITLTGTSTAGPLVGTGVNNTVSLTFTPTAGTLTLTVSGSCTNVQLEAGAFRSSWIPTAGASVTRDADILTISSPGITYPTTLWAEFESPMAAGAAVTRSLIHVDDGGATERVNLRVTATDLVNALMTDGGVNQGDVSVAGAIAANTTYKTAAAFNTNRVQSCRGGTLGTADTSATLPATPTAFRIGNNSAAGAPAFSYFKRVAAFNSALSDANLQTVAP